MEVKIMEVKIMVTLDNTGIELTIEEARKLYNNLDNLFSFRFPTEEIIQLKEVTK